MAEQGDGDHGRPNEGHIIRTDDRGDWRGRDNFFGNRLQEDLEVVPYLAPIVRRLNLMQLNNNYINLEYVINFHNENNYNNGDDENDHNYGSYNFAERNDGHQDENALAGDEVDYEINPDAGEVEEDLLPGGSRKRSREEDSEDENSHDSRNFHWWDEFADSSSEEEDDDSLLEGYEESDESDEDERDVLV